MMLPEKNLSNNNNLNSTAEKKAPKSVCLLRLSALGDVTHMLPVIHRLQHRWPDTQLTWIIGKTEYKMVCDLPDIDFLVVDKKSDWGGVRSIIDALKGRRFDVLLHMQVSLRANLISSFVRAPRKIGYDRARSRDMHGIFINERIQAGNQEHVVDAFQRFLDTAGVPEHNLDWSLPVAPADAAWAENALKGRRSLLISPCSSHKLRNWSASRYAQVADYAAKQHGLQIVLCGGRSSFEREMGDEILSLMTEQAIDLIGKDTIKQLLALIQQAAILITPDSGPAHMAACYGTQVLGLYAASNPHRSGPYLSIDSTVNSYDLAAHKFLDKSTDQLRWGTKIEKLGVMDLILVEDVTSQLDKIMATMDSGQDTAS